MTNFKNYHRFTGVRREKYYKDTVFQGDFLMAGINCFEPGQVQAIHDHAEQDKLYLAVQGDLIWAAAGMPHGVENRGDERLVVLVFMSPPPK